MADVKDQAVQETSEVTEPVTAETTGTTTNKQTSDYNDYSFTQEQVDEVVAKRLAREREAVAKKLGIERYDAMDSFIESYQETVTMTSEMEEQMGDLMADLFDRELRLTALQHGVQADHLDRTVKLAVAELEMLGEEDDIDLSAAMQTVLNDFPMLKGAEQPVRKVGAQTTNDGESRTEIDRYLEKYKDSKYFKK